MVTLEDIQAFLEETLGVRRLNVIRDACITALFLIVLFIVGWVVGQIISSVVRRILSLPRLERGLVSYGAVSSELWASVVGFVSKYTLWLVVFAVLTLSGVQLLHLWFYNILVPLTVFIVFVIVGLLLGGVVHTVVRDALAKLRVEEGLKRYELPESLFGVPISVVMAGVGKWYTFLIFLTTGLEVALGMVEDITLVERVVLVKMLRNFVFYLPSLTLGVLILLVSFMLSSFIGRGIRRKKVQYGDLIATGAEVLIILFGVVLALPHIFWVTEAGVFTYSLSLIVDSFKILMVGVAAGVAIAVALSLRDILKERLK